MKDLIKYQVPLTFTIKEAVSQMDDGGIGFCVVIDEEKKVIGVISDGDFRRAALSGQDLDCEVGKILNKSFVYVTEDDGEDDLENIFSGLVVDQIPILNDGFLIDIVTKDKFYGLEKLEHLPIIKNPVVIMAGGKGTRMDPFTRILPKPLIPVGDDPAIKVIMDNFWKFGMNEFHISLNDKGRMIKAYFYEHELPYNIKFIEEKKPLGTAGALKYLIEKITVPFFVSNCDVIIHTNYAAIMDFHSQSGHGITLVASMRHYKVPYGVCEVSASGILSNIREKPEYDFLVNTGLYIIDPKLLNLIPSDTYFDMPDLIEEAQRRGLEVGVFPVSEKSWKDIGQWPEYKESLSNLF
jgi:dTDP-glucose pyrophosphorylase